MGAGVKGLGLALLAALAVATALAPQAEGAQRSRCSGGGSLLGAPSESLPVELPGSLETAILTLYGVFRRPAQEADRLPPINSAGGELEGDLSGYYGSEIRQVASLADGRRFFVVPGLPRVMELPPPGCVPKAFRKQLAKSVEEQRKHQTEPEYCIIEIGPQRGASNTECVAFAAIDTSARVFSPSFFRPTTSAVLVPDGVASVRIVGPGTRQATLPVSENAYLDTMPHDLVLRQQHLLRHVLNRKPVKHPTKAQRRQLSRLLDRTFRTIVLETEPTKVEWLGPGGALVKSISRPSTFRDIVGAPTAG
jgi:hypothetical protein